MIQRIQTLFLAIALVAVVLAFFYPVASFWSENYSLRLSLAGIDKIHDQSGSVQVNTIPLIALNSIAGLLILISIFLYKKRILQLRMVRFAIFADIIMLVLLFFFYIPQIEEHTTSSAEYLSEPGIYFPLVALVFLTLAIRYIVRDEKLVRSADRIR
ncbi:MAG: DUF4293 domain-containing protein [Bacteroidetes bacterium]|nr:DUF4293 domain-containing protein [Bacteroidota bacterium]